MICSKCNNTIDKVKIYSIRNTDGQVIGIQCRFCGYNHFKKLKTKSVKAAPFEEVLEDDYEQS